MTPEEALIATIEAFARITEAARTSWFARRADGDSLVVLLEVQDVVEYGGGNVTFRVGSLAAMALETGLEEFVKPILPLARLEEAVPEHLERLYHPLATLILAKPIKGDIVTLRVANAVLKRTRAETSYFIDAYVSTRLYRMYDAVSTTRDCCGNVKLEGDGVEVKAYTLPALIKCLATGSLGLGCNERPTLEELTERVRSISSGKLEQLVNAADPTATIAVVAKAGRIELRPVRRLLYTLREEREHLE